MTSAISEMTSQGDTNMCDHIHRLEYVHLKEIKLHDKLGYMETNKKKKHASK